MADITIRTLKANGEPRVTKLLAEVFSDKREAILGKVDGWSDVVAALMSEYCGTILVAEIDGRIVGAAALRAEKWSPGEKTTKVVLSKVGILRALWAKRRLTKLLSRIPELEKGEGMLDALGVDEKHRRRGAAKALLREGSNWVKGQGAKQLCLSVKEDNTPAVRLYSAEGFTVARKYSIAWGDSFYMKKELK